MLLKTIWSGVGYSNANSVKWLPSLKTFLFLFTARKHKSSAVQLRNAKAKSFQLSLEVQDQQYMVALELF